MRRVYFERRGYVKVRNMSGDKNKVKDIVPIFEDIVI